MHVLPSQYHFHRTVIVWRAVGEGCTIVTVQNSVHHYEHISKEAVRIEHISFGSVPGRQLGNHCN